MTVVAMAVTNRVGEARLWDQDDTRRKAEPALPGYEGREKVYARISGFRTVRVLCAGAGVVSTAAKGLCGHKFCWVLFIARSISHIFPLKQTAKYSGVIFSPLFFLYCCEALIHTGVRINCIPRNVGKNDT